MDTTSTQSDLDIFARLGMSQATEEQKQALAEQMAELTMQRFMDKVGQQLSTTEYAYVEGLIDAKMDDMVEPALRERLSNYDELLTQTAREVEETLLRDQSIILSTARAQAANHA